MQDQSEGPPSHDQRESVERRAQRCEVEGSLGARGRMRDVGSRVGRGTAAALATVALGAGAAVALVACGEDREGSVENIGGGTTGTGATTGATVPTGATTGATTGAATTGTTTTETTEGE